MRAKQWRHGLYTGVLMLIALWLLVSIWGLAKKAHVAVSEANEVKAHYAELEGRKATLEANLAALNTDRGEDAAIRTAFGVARPGEEVIVVVPPPPATTTPPRSWWQKLFDLF